ncbi:RabGAP/TBC [Macrolepiota fuliginosa MF-IS2]|uniref:RabGAP/TBC n=1 Tax=Macrolepiota fuliginosa MF-IS2 TaxID=1400762 RepID=A0A9P5XLR9_9AGAR|nr:RabGAP/TBC [Macrolepiota fuliginosa MF-IS2]
MNPISPPARPHIAVHPTHFSTPSTTDWDDAWDSGSDSEDARQSTWKRTGSTAERTPPKQVLRSNSTSSSSTLAFSYTHVNAPDPASYPPSKSIDEPPPRTRPQNGWTIVDRRPSIDPSTNQPHDADVEGDMIIGDIDPDLDQPPPNNHLAAQSKQMAVFVREDAEQIVNDPLHGVRQRPGRRDVSPATSRQPSKSSDHPRDEKLMRERSIRTNRRHKFLDCLTSQDVNISELRKLAWAGIPADFRPLAWQLLLGYLPLPASLRAATLARKRSEYLSLVELTFARGREGLDQQIWHQIEIDVPRTRPGVRLWMHGATQRSLERVLYVWAIRHPASGYVQGINDLATPFFQVFLSAYIDSDPESFDPSVLPKNVLDAIEADSFWCLSRLLDGIQDNYIFAQPGIVRSVKRMAELVSRIDAPLFAHLESQSVEFMQFAFRWMNCLLMREISVQNTIRMWDTYLAEGPDAFSQFHLYVCSAFLVRWSEKLRQMDFQGIIMFLQSLPTQDWGDHEIELLLSEAFVLNSIWHNAQSHFGAK